MKLWMVGCVGLLTTCGSSGTTHEEASVDVTQLLEVATVVEHAVAEDSGVPLEAEPAGHAEELAVVVEEQPVEPATTKERHVYRLRHGETLHHFAKWSDRTVWRMSLSRPESSSVKTTMRERRSRCVSRP